MAYPTLRAVALLLVAATSVSVATELELKKDAIELSLSEETAYVHLMSSIPTGRPVASVRVQNPNRDYSVIKITLEAGESGAKHQLKVRNGYNHVVLFTTSCSQVAEADRPDQLLVGAPPGGESKMDLPSSVTRTSLCDFTVALDPSR